MTCIVYDGYALHVDTVVYRGIAQRIYRRKLQTLTRPNGDILAWASCGDLAVCDAISEYIKSDYDFDLYQKLSSAGLLGEQGEINTLMIRVPKDVSPDEHEILAFGNMLKPIKIEPPAFDRIIAIGAEHTIVEGAYTTTINVMRKLDMSERGFLVEVIYKGKTYFHTDGDLARWVMRQAFLGTDYNISDVKIESFNTTLDILRNR